MQGRPGKTANTERYLFVLHVLQLLLGLGAVQPLFWLVSARCWKAFLAVSALCHLYKVGPQHTHHTDTQASRWSDYTAVCLALLRGLQSASDVAVCVRP